MSDTLASFIQKKRDKIGLSTSGLAKRSNLELTFLEDIEAGKELFLPVTVRQKLAKVLKCEPEELLKLERSYQDIIIPDEVISSIKQRILNKENDIKCPRCGEILVVRVAKYYDLEDNLVLTPKAHCSKCTFQLKD